MQAEGTAESNNPRDPARAAELEFKEVSKRYVGTDEPALRDLSFKVPAGDICVLVGPSGCGKTTAMRMVNRMIDITEGDILLDERARRSHALDRLAGELDARAAARDLNHLREAEIPARNDHLHRPTLIPLCSHVSCP